MKKNNRAGMAAVMPDSTAVRAHMCAAGGSKRGASINSAWAGAGVVSAAKSFASSMRLASPYSSS